MLMMKSARLHQFGGRFIFDQIPMPTQGGISALLVTFPLDSLAAAADFGPAAAGLEFWYSMMGAPLDGVRVI